MAQIYATASIVFVVLGASEKAERAVSVVNGMCSHIDRHRWDMKMKSDDYKKLTKDELQECTQYNWPAFRTMMLSEWFMRVWVVQEVGLAQDGIVLYGDKEFPWQSLIKVLAWLSELGFEVYAFHNLPGGTVLQMWISFNVDQRNPYSSFQQYSVLDLLGHPSFRELQDSSESALKPNYNETHFQVYHDFAVQWLEENHASQILSCIYHKTLVLPMVDHTEETLSALVNCPSWVPQWHYLPIGGSRFNTEHNHLGIQHQASGPSQFHFRRLSGGRLEAQGFIFDQVYMKYVKPVEQVRRSDRIATSWLSDNAYESLLVLCSVCWKMLLTHPAAPELELVYAFAETAVARLTKNAEREPPLVSFSTCVAEVWRILCSEESTRDSLYNVAVKELYEKCKNEAECATELMGYVARTDTMGEGRSFFTTKTYRVGLGPAVMDAGDVCCIIKGADVPYILRRFPGSDEFLLVGESYVYGAMDGDVVKQFCESDNSDKGWTSIVLR